MQTSTVRYRGVTTHLGAPFSIHIVERLPLFSVPYQQAVISKSSFQQLTQFKPLSSHNFIMTSSSSMANTSQPKSKVAMLGKIPRIQKIKESLGLEMAPIDTRNEFRDYSRKWRETNKTSDGRPATELLDWYSEADQADLRSLAERFVTEKAAQKYWSPTRNWKYNCELQLPDDKEK